MAVDAAAVGAAAAVGGERASSGRTGGEAATDMMQQSEGPAIGSALLIAVVLVAGCASAPRPDQKGFSSAEEAARTLVAAVRAHDEPELLAILGPDATEVLSSGDKVADQQNREQFLSLWDEFHAVVAAEDGSRVVQVGKDEWPFPIDLVEEDGLWYFDTVEGKYEILSRRVGRNEQNAIQVCAAFVDAEREFAHGDPDGNGLHDYAPRFLSDPGKRNGLYWQTKEGEPRSPLGPLVAAASREGYVASGDQAESSSPYHGYIYRILKRQDGSAAGGSFDYVVNGKMIGGFALVAYPAEYENSGVMTFIVNHDGVVYQKDLGPDTERIATKMSAFDPGGGWVAAE